MRSSRSDQLQWTLPPVPVVEPFFESRRVQQIHHPESHPGSFVAISRTNTALGGPETAMSLANLPLEYVEAMGLDLDEVVLRQRRIGARPRGVVVHVVGNACRTAREQENAVGEIDRLFEVVRDQHRRRAGFDKDALELVAHE